MEGIIEFFTKDVLLAVVAIVAIVAALLARVFGQPVEDIRDDVRNAIQVAKGGADRAIDIVMTLDDAIDEVSLTLGTGEVQEDDAINILLERIQEDYPSITASTVKNLIRSVVRLTTAPTTVTGDPLESIPETHASHTLRNIGMTY